MHYKEHVNLEDRELLQLNGPGNYRVKNNRIVTRAIEINAVRHCNLSCRGCSHSSPISKQKIYEPKVLEKDLLKIAQFITAEFVRVVGGEPLLHPDFFEFLKTIKNSGISQKICLVTNGLLLDNITEDAYKYIDKVEISIYPLSISILKKIKEKAIKLNQAGIKVRLLEYSSFREAITKETTNDVNLIQLIYDTCQIAHTWRCITIDNNRIFRCPQSMINDEINNNYSDSLRIDEIKTIDDLLKFLENNDYLASCQRCLGSVGNKINHEQVKESIWESLLPLTPEEGIDREYAKKLIKTSNFKSDCLEKNYIT